MSYFIVLGRCIVTSTEAKPAEIIDSLNLLHWRHQSLPSVVHATAVLSFVFGIWILPCLLTTAATFEIRVLHMDFPSRVCILARLHASYEILSC